MDDVINFLLQILVLCLEIQELSKLFLWYTSGSLVRRVCCAVALFGRLAALCLSQHACA